MSSVRSRRLDRFAREATQARIQALRLEMKRARRSQHPDQVHDLRVSIRRLRACLAAFPTVFSRHRTRSLRKRLRRLFHLAGRVRDADIAVELRSGDPRACKDLRAARRKDARRLRRKLRKGPRRSILRRARAALRHAAPDPRDAAALAAENLGAEMAALLAHGERAVPSDAPPQQLHQLRIRVKKLRYACEIFEPLLGRAARERIDLLSGLQDVLGAIQDCQTALAHAAPDDLSFRADAEARRESLRGRLREYWRRRLDDAAPAVFRAATGSAGAT
ncbi:MAG: CHAD domain-containing protein [Acidobacteria bacterium]|nr:CHAD domain-containing protein [Acidobacteriota bacterium]